MRAKRLTEDAAPGHGHPIPAGLLALLWLGCSAVAYHAWTTEGCEVTDDVILRSYAIGVPATARAVWVFLDRATRSVPKWSLMLAVALAAVILAGAQVR